MEGGGVQATAFAISLVGHEPHKAPGAPVLTQGEIAPEMNARMYWCQSSPARQDDEAHHKGTRGRPLFVQLRGGAPNAISENTGRRGKNRMIKGTERGYAGRDLP